MHKDECQEISTTVIETTPKARGLEYWVRDEDGRERSYFIRDPKLTARAGHELTEIRYRGHTIAMRNEATMRKIVVLGGEDLLGQGPPIVKRGLGFWAVYFFCTLPLALWAATWHDSYPPEYWQTHIIKHLLVNGACLVVILGLLIINPLRLIFWDDVKRFRHNRRIKAVNATIRAIYDEL